MNRLHAFILCATLPLLGCAQGTVDPLDDAGSSTTGVLVQDMGPVVPTNNQNTMNPMPDTGSSTNNCGVCCPGDSTCLDQETRGTCRADGSGFDPTPCAEGSACVEGVCQVGPACVPGSIDCFDNQTVIRCRQSGDGYVQMTCDDGYQCSQGMCTDKVPLGGGCATDEECATGNCRCGSGTDDNCPPALGDGICADTECTAGSCGLSAGCLDSAIVPTGGADYDHCVRSCSDEEPCPDGSRCVAVPVKVGNSWEYRQACYFTGAKSFGDECDSDGQCLTGKCLTGYFDTGFCTRACDDDGLCPGNGACVELESSSNQFWCTLKCGDGSVTGTEDCPLDEPVERFDVGCARRSAKNGGVLRVCVAN